VLEAYREHVAERASQNIPPKPLSAEQVAGLVELLKNPPAGEEDFLIDLITTRVPPGVDEAAYVKAGFLSAIARGEQDCSLIDRAHAVKLLGNMHGGYNIEALVGLLTDDALGEQAAAELKHTLLSRQRQRQGGDAELGRCGMVYQSRCGARIDQGCRVQGNRRNQYR